MVQLQHILPLLILCFVVIFILLVINGPTASNKDLFDAPGLYLDQK